MANLYGRGCRRCSEEIAAAMNEMPHKEGYLDTKSYWDRHRGLPKDKIPSVYVGGVRIAEVTSIVSGNDGWVLALTDKGRTCSCGSHNMSYDLWRGTVELR